MVNTIEFGNRLHQMMEFYKLSASAFADSLAIGRSSISHILSGRNKPSLEFILKIVDTYTDIDIHWLLYGKGTFPKSETTANTATSGTIPLDNLIKISPEKDEQHTDLFSQTINTTPVTEASIENKESIPTNKHTSTKAIARILICYTDGTFDTYS